MTGFFISGLVFYLLNLAFPIDNMDQVDAVDLYGTFTQAEARRIGVVQLDEAPFPRRSLSRHPNDKVMATEGEKEV
jgi:NCS1 family nucleobase:cation symporter-1